VVSCLARRVEGLLLLTEFPMELLTALPRLSSAIPTTTFAYVLGERGQSAVNNRHDISFCLNPLIPLSLPRPSKADQPEAKIAEEPLP
jgi:hypothetical protein